MSKASSTPSVPDCAELVRIATLIRDANWFGPLSEGEANYLRSLLAALREVLPSDQGCDVAPIKDWDAT